jgi:Uncharacterized conserved protein
MKSIDLMVSEHKLIKRMLTVLRKASFKAIETGEVDYEDFAAMIDFVRVYADGHHHGKEEEFLFDEMVKHAGPAAEKLVTHGMLVEHDLGRLYIKGLEDALIAHKSGDREVLLDVIGNAIGYTHLLHRHIDKEDQVVYPFAERTLSEEVLEAVDLRSEAFENEQLEKGIQEKYMKVLALLESKYVA